jgi:hypothetical protein
MDKAPAREARDPSTNRKWVVFWDVEETIEIPFGDRGNQEVALIGLLSRLVLKESKNAGLRLACVTSHGNRR